MSREVGVDHEPRSVLRNFSDLVAKLLVSGGLLYWLLSGFDLAAFGSILQHTHILLFVLAAGFFALSNVLGAFQWYLLLRGQALGVSLRQAIVLYWVGVFFNNVLLGNIGGDAIRIYDVRRLTRETSRAAAATFMDRFVGLFSTCCLALGACVLVAEVRRPGLVTMLVSVWSGLVVLLALGLSRRLGSQVERVLRRLPARVSRILGELRSNFVVYRAKAPLLVGVWLVSLGVQFSRILVYWTAGTAVGLEVGLRFFIGFQPVAAIAAALPISVGGLGVREGVLVELFGGIGVEESLAFATSILGYGAGILASLLGGILFIVRRIHPVDTPQQT